MFTVYRNCLRYGREDDPIDTKHKEFGTLDKAIAYALRYARGLRFVSAQVYDEADNLVYDICDYGAKVYDDRARFGYPV